MSIPYDLAAEERAKRRYYFIVLPLCFVALCGVMIIGHRWLPSRLRDWATLAFLVSGLSIAQAWSERRGWRTIVGQLLWGALLAGLWVWSRGGL
jgi:hypothetical protein